ncbi:MAG TPA: RdgB/HAM1 family non-canonical purine NTP pyrophosphatase [Gammaproteobacteria bacterium]|jgi:XTP/dITP diphosphohydrolase|nr:non-canonical purine NTP pyrophosphatase, RdgB/HAM1 family [Chromatiales bacterium]MCP4926665.1 RdgB/HAM1 family non-canonical purine NTP pyrophosphatase [Gammaproteobacteria bacterium]MDP7153985.1 RdgB/HAM1 family non-canonical purine NTP pyrophosphatase [Gammaproteobacteria bacterium]MDP7295954.1 RdgB/HAM1 family non-canonical purine NTP pyrophosphatase [Gammaproteobacteria bacterium]MDP7660378.1 RdgB/HAM1 family non-canonical purine NTP pyrophosphatase [Gammaproteobacteria bacterium]
MAGGVALRIILATGNPGKLRELQKLLGERFELVPQAELNISPIEETGRTFVQNALLKARHASSESGLPAIADDSGLEVDALGGAPGIRSARYAGSDATDEENNHKLLAELGACPEIDRTARFRSSMVYVRAPDDPEPFVAEGVWEGRILDSPRGTGGFGYDPLFLDESAGLTGGELGADDKNRRSHRGQAARRLSAMLVTGRIDAKVK